MARHTSLENAITYERARNTMSRFGGQIKIVDDVEPQSLHYALDVSNASNIRMRQFSPNIADKTAYEVGASGGVTATINLPASGFVNGRESYLRFQIMTF